jgi:hypothetical protein
LTLLFISPFSFSAPQNDIPLAEDDSEEWQDDWAEETESPWQVSGFTKLSFGHFLQNNIVKSNASLKEVRNRVNVNYSHEEFEIKVKGDLLFDNVLSDALWQTRELTIATSPLSMLDIKVGRQVLTWGTGDYLFLNDLFAKDWQSFFSGRDDAYLKSPSTSLRTTWYLGNTTLDIAWTPEFTPDKFITGERFSYYSPQTQKLVAPAENFKLTQTNNEQWSARFAISKNSVEYSLYGYHGYWPTPQGVSEDSLPYFPRLNAFGASVRLPINKGWFNGIFNSEFSLYNSIEDHHGDDPFIANDQLRLLVGYEQEILKNLTASAQYYLEQTKDYDAYKSSSWDQEKIVAKNRNILTLRLRYSAMQQKLTLTVFIFYSPSDKDSFIKPSINYRYNDQWSYAIGANIFQGKNPYSFFGQHQKNSNAWLSAKYLF